MLTKQEAAPCVDKEEVKVEVERYIDLARQMEAFFLQKRLVGERGRRDTEVGDRKEKVRRNSSCILLTGLEVFFLLKRLVTERGRRETGVEGSRQEIWTYST